MEISRQEVVREGRGKRLWALFQVQAQLSPRQSPAHSLRGRLQELLSEVADAWADF